MEEIDLDELDDGDNVFKEQNEEENVFSNDDSNEASIKSINDSPQKERK